MNRILVGVFAILYLVAALQLPNGDWDAWAIWNLRAKFLYYFDDPRVAFQAVRDWPHLDYPPLLPLLVSYGWRIFGMSEFVPIVLHGAAYIAILWLLSSDWWAVVLFGIVGLRYAPTQYADTPLALCLLGAVIAQTKKRETLAGLLLGTGALLKNEGLLFVVLFLVVQLASERKLSFQVLRGLALPLVALFVFKFTLVIEENDLLGTTGKLERVIDLTRYPVIVKNFIIGFFSFASGAVILLVLWGVVLEARVSLRSPIALLLVLTFLSYLAIYAITPHEVSWHVTHSLDRLLYQVFPLGILLVSEGVRTRHPE